MQLGESKVAKYNCDYIDNYFLWLANKTGTFISNLKLQKLVYYAQAWHLAIKKEPLIDDDFEAWVHGPVIYSLWKKYSGYKFHPIMEDVEKPSFDSETEEFLKQVSEVYFHEDGYALELMTHRESPWIIARKGCSPEEHCSNIISKTSMEKYYSTRMED